MIKLVSALSLVASAPSLLSGQNPTPSLRHRAAPVAAERLVAKHLAKGGNARNHMMMMDAASMFLAHTGDMHLTDAQVTKLAAIARRAEAREKAMQTRMDSAMAMVRERAEAPQDGVARPLMTMVRMSRPTDAERRAQHEDDREAFSIPTPDQLALAWEAMYAEHAGR